MSLTMSCAFNTSMDSPEHARIAEDLGYARAWFYDSPAICADVWMQLARAAERTTRIGLGTGVLIPALRHPMITATAIANLVELAGQDRVAIGVGTGFTGRLTLGQRPVTWSSLAVYVDTVQRLLRGEYAEWDGAKIVMMHRPGFAAARPIEVPFIAGVVGPKGIAYAKDHAAGAFTSRSPVPGFDWEVHLTFGTVLEPGESPGSPRAIEAAGHAAAIWVHRALEFGDLEAVPRGAEWAAAYADIPADIRHIELHDGHLWTINDRDRPFVTGEVLEAGGVALSAAGWRERLARLEEEGATEVAYQPAGPDVPRELEAFADAMRG